MEQWTWCFIAEWCADLACVMLCFVCVLVFCYVAGGQELSDWSNNTSLKDNRWGNYSWMDRTERCEPCWSVPFVGIWVPVVFGTRVSISCNILCLAHVLLSHDHKYLSQVSPTLGHVYCIVSGTRSSVSRHTYLAHVSPSLNTVWHTSLSHAT